MSTEIDGVREFVADLRSSIGLAGVAEIADVGGVAETDVMAPVPECVARSAHRGAVLAARSVLVLLGAWLSLFRLSVPSWNIDETIYAAASEAYRAGDLRPNPEHPPVGKYLIGASQALFGDTLSAARLPAALMLLGSGLLVWVWLGRVGPRASGPIAAVLIWSLPVLDGFPEAPDRPPDSSVLARAALLDPLAAGIALTALIAGWWWITTHRTLAAGCCGFLSGLACATKIPAGLIVVVPLAVGCVAAACCPGTVPARLFRAVGQAACWTVAATAAFVGSYLPMGTRAPATFERMVRVQRRHGAAGHMILVNGSPRLHAPWWINLSWQYDSWGALLSTAAVAALLAGFLARSGLAAYLTAAWLLPAVALAPVTGLALPHYLVLWRPALIVSVTVAAVAGVSRLWRAARGDSRLLRRAGQALAVGLAAVIAVSAAAPTVRSVEAVATLRPTGYAALPAVIPADATVVLVGDLGPAHRYLPGCQLLRVSAAQLSGDPAPAAIVLARGSTLRNGDHGLAAWARARGYQHLRTGPLDVWLAPGRPA